MTTRMCIWRAIEDNSVTTELLDIARKLALEHSSKRHCSRTQRSYTN